VTRHHKTCKRGDACTLYSGRPSAALCRVHHWKAGDVLEGDEGYGPERITLTAVGEQSILAKGPGGYESAWTLASRCWGRVRI